jgi:hydrogenase-4 component B
MLSGVLFAGAIFIALAGAVVSAVLDARPAACRKVSFLLAAIASCFGMASAITVFAGDIMNITIFVTPSLGTFSFGTYSIAMDGLAAFFVMVISLLTLIVSIYSLDYVESYQGVYSMGLMGCLWNLFFVTMALVIVANNAMLFIIAWECMSLVSFFLVIYERNKKESLMAGLVYVIMTHVGTAFIIISFIIMASISGSFDFASFTTPAFHAALTPGVKAVLFIMLFIGFSVKAGVVPLHVWLPLAHPEAPSNVSALMSGVMIKTPVFMLIRVTFSFLGIGAGDAWWGIVIIVIGSLSAIIGVLYANVEQDMKRLLAYHSVENIGIIFIGLGTSILFQSLGQPLIATLALVGTLYHVLSHAIFKGLLFMGAGSIQHSTHTKNVEELGGLAKLMPRTSVFYFFGVMSITALPPFNGFVSEWLIFQSLMISVTLLVAPVIQVFIMVAIAILAISGGLAIACFVHTYGVTFLAMPRTEHARNAKEAPRLMQWGMGVLAVGCLATGLASFVLIPVFGGAAMAYTGSGALTSGLSWFFMVPIVPGFTGFSPAMVLLAMVIVMPIIYGVSRVAGGKQKVEIADTWDCGTPLNARNEYTATAYSNPINKVFTRIFRPKPRVETTPSASLYIFKEKKYTANEKELVIENRFYVPLVQNVVKFARKIRGMQSGSIRNYLLYIFATLMVLLIIFR